MDTERNLAKLHGYSDPIWENYNLTSDAYNDAVGKVLHKKTTLESKISLYIAGHNSESIYLAKKKYLTTQKSSFSY